MNTKTIQHSNPVWRDKANFIIGIKLQASLPDFDIVLERLWGEQIADHRFIICCIPYFAYDLSLGDEVETDTEYMIKEVVKASGQYTFRMLFEKSIDMNFKDVLVKELDKRGCLVEWYSSKLLAVSCSEQYSQSIANLLLEKETLGLLSYETGETAYLGLILNNIIMTEPVQG